MKKATTDKNSRSSYLKVFYREDDYKFSQNTQENTYDKVLGFQLSCSWQTCKFPTKGFYQRCFLVTFAKIFKKETFY